MIGDEVGGGAEGRFSPSTCRHCGSDRRRPSTRRVKYLQVHQRCKVKFCVAVPECLYRIRIFHPGSEVFHPGSRVVQCSSRIRTQDTGVKKATDPGSGSATLEFFFTFSYACIFSSGLFKKEYICPIVIH
jgi:hypothetical protein